MSDITERLRNLVYLEQDAYSVMEAADEIDRLRAELDALRKLCSAAYQVVGAADGPMEMIDNLFEAASGRSLRHDAMAGLPWTQPAATPAPVAQVPGTSENVMHVLADLDDMAQEGWMECARAAAVIRGMLASAKAPVAQRVPPIERDETMDRTYIPLPGGWEVQTKGSGSTFRVCDTKSGDRWPITDCEWGFGHAEWERMAREIHAAAQAQGEEK